MESPYALHLALAALVGASFAAASAYYMHRKTLDQLLRFARDQQRRRNRLLPDGDELEDGEDDEDYPPAHRDHDRRTLPIPPGLPPLHTGREGSTPPAPFTVSFRFDSIRFLMFLTHGCVPPHSHVSRDRRANALYGSLASTAYSYRIWECTLCAIV